LNLVGLWARTPYVEGEEGGSEGSRNYIAGGPARLINVPSRGKVHLNIRGGGRKQEGGSQEGYG